MQNYCKTIGALAAASALVAGNASAEVEYDLHTGYSTMYLWRGQDLGDDLIEVGANVKGEWNGIGLSAGAWYGSFDQDTRAVAPFNGSANANELDLYAEASKDFGFLKASVGYIYYAYPQGDVNNRFLDQIDSQEVYFGISRDFGFVTASYTYFWGVQGADNNGYSELALSRSFVINPCITVNLGTNVGYQFEEGQATAWTTKVSLDWAFVEHAKLSPFVAFSVALSDDANSTYTAHSDNELVAGSMLSVSF
ncbi:MAG: hypothetical protein WCS43_05435 [Verrucomicrobiota bacterium]